MDFLKQFDVIRLFAGLGIFLYGMYLLELGIRKLSDKTLKYLIQKATQNRFKSLLTGIVGTAIVQSSSATSLLVLAFVGAGYMSLDHAFVTIMGSSLGTTFNSWIVAFFGFKVKIEVFALPFIALGGLLYLIKNQSKKLSHVSKIIMGLGMLFLGLDYMKTSVDTFAETIDISAFPTFGILFYVIFGIVITALMQASSATIAIALTAVNSGLIGFDAGIAIVIGANIGTTVTVLMGAIGGSPSKKRVALSHLIFKFVTAVIAVILLDPSSYFIRETLGYHNNHVIGLAIYHTLFNMMGILLFLPFVSNITSLLKRLYKEKETVVLHYLGDTSPEIPETAIMAMHNEIIHLLKEALIYNIRFLELDEYLIDKVSPGYTVNKQVSLDRRYSNLKRLGNEIFSYGVRLQGFELKQKQVRKIDLYLHAARSIMNAAKNFKDIKNNLSLMKSSDNKIYQESYRQLQLLFSGFILDGIELIKIKNKKQFLDAYSQLKQDLMESDKAFIQKNFDAIQNNQIDKAPISDILMANRLLNHSCQLFITSAFELFDGK